MCSYKYLIDDWIIGKVFAYQIEEGFICLTQKLFPYIFKFKVVPGQRTFAFHCFWSSSQKWAMIEQKIKK